MASQQSVGREPYANSSVEQQSLRRFDAKRIRVEMERIERFVSPRSLLEIAWNVPTIRIANGIFVVLKFF